MRSVFIGVLLLAGCATSGGPRTTEERAAQARDDAQRVCVGAPPTDLRPFAR